MKYKYTDEDVAFLKENYPIGNWDAIFERFPGQTKTSIYKKAHKMGISYNKDCKIYPREFKNRKHWTDDEIDILKECYSYYPIDEVIFMLKERTKNAIILKANKLQLISYTKLNELWTEREKQYIVDNWELEPDVVMSKKLNRSVSAVKCKREQLGLYRVNFEEKSYPTLSKYLRGQNQQWKKDSMKFCNYQCVLTGSKNFEIHHLYGVSNIINDMFRDNKFVQKDDIKEYSELELSIILKEFLHIQSQYPLGECVDKKIHSLFHSLYGQYYNTPEQ